MKPARKEYYAIGVKALFQVPHSVYVNVPDRHRKAIMTVDMGRSITARGDFNGQMARKMASQKRPRRAFPGISPGIPAPCRSAGLLAAAPPEPLPGGGLVPSKLLI